MSSQTEPPCARAPSDGSAPTPHQYVEKKRRLVPGGHPKIIFECVRCRDTRLINTQTTDPVTMQPWPDGPKPDPDPMHPDRIRHIASQPEGILVGDFVCKNSNSSQPHWEPTAGSPDRKVEVLCKELGLERRESVTPNGPGSLRKKVTYHAKS